MIGEPLKWQIDEVYREGPYKEIKGMTIKQIHYNLLQDMQLMVHPVTLRITRLINGGAGR